MVPLPWSLQKIGGNTKSVQICHHKLSIDLSVPHFLNHQLTSQIHMLISERFGIRKRKKKASNLKWPHDGLLLFLTLSSLLNHPFVGKQESNGSKTMARWQLSSYVMSNQIQCKTINTDRFDSKECCIWSRKWLVTNMSSHQAHYYNDSFCNPPCVLKIVDNKLR
jgi:hypothetical protein